MAIYQIGRSNDEAGGAVDADCQVKGNLQRPAPCVFGPGQRQEQLPGRSSFVMDMMFTWLLSRGVGVGKGDVPTGNAYGGRVE